jgi:tetratricopeptide (TPR) repeat protein
MSESAKKALVVFTYVVLVLSTLLVFWQVRNFDFVNYDDNDYVYENPQVLNGLTPIGVIRAFTTSYLGYWQPMTWLSLMLDCQLFGSDPGWMHLVNVFLHLANALLLFAILKKITGSLWPSAFVAAAFALHPMHVESVAWITERKDVLNTLFLLLTLAAYVSYVRHRGVGRYLMTVLLFAAGLLGKPMLVTLPFLLLLLDYWPLNRLMAQRAATDGSREGISVAAAGKHLNLGCLVEKIPFLVLSAIFSIIAFLTQQAGGGVGDIKTIPIKDRVANAFCSYAAYMGKMFWPHNMAAHYPFTPDSFVFWQVAMCVLLLLVISIFVIHFGREQKYLPVGWFWFVGTLLPVIGLVHFMVSSYADRFTYIPYIGLFIMVAWGLPELLSKWPQRKPVLGISALIALAALGICAHRQVSYWSNSVTLFSHALEVTKDNDLAYNNRGEAYTAIGRTAEAIEDLRQAIKINPYFAESYNDLGNVYNKLGRLPEAMDAYQQAIKIKPYLAEAHNNLGTVYSGLGRLQEAIDAYQQAINIKPDFVRAHYNRGVAYCDLGRWQEAIDDFGQVIRIEPDDVEAYNNRGAAYRNWGRSAEAIEDFRKAIKIKPDYIEARCNLAGGLAGQGRFDEALDQYRTILQLKPDWPDCMSNIAFIIATNPKLKNRDTNEAIRLARGACEIANYKNPAFLDTLAAAYASAGRFSEAVDAAKKALDIADATNQPKIRNVIQYHLSLYTQGKPCIGPSPRPLTDPNKP